LPALLTVIDLANEPRAAAARKLMKYKKAQSPAEAGSEEKAKSLEEKGLLIKQWDLDYLKADLNFCGREGSPTKVHKIQSVVLEAKESKQVAADAVEISAMVHELIEEHTIG
jgi:electron transfer flavoprotein beta subunit